CATMQVNGYTRLLVQTDLDGYNLEFKSQVQEACHNHGVAYGIWQDIFSSPSTPGDAQMLIHEWDAGWFEANVEGGSVDPSWAGAFRSLEPSIYAAIFTDFTPFS